MAARANDDQVDPVRVGEDDDLFGDISGQQLRRCVDTACGGGGRCLLERFAVAFVKPVRQGAGHSEAAGRDDVDRRCDVDEDHLGLVFVGELEAELDRLG